MYKMLTQTMREAEKFQDKLNKAEQDGYKLVKFSISQNNYYVALMHKENKE